MDNKDFNTDIQVNSTGPMNFDEQSYNSNSADVASNKIWDREKSFKYSSNNTGRVSNLSKWSLALSLLGCTTFIGGILAIIDLTYKDGRKKVVSIISLCICGLVLIFFVTGRIHTSLERKRINNNTQISSSVPGDDTIPTETTTEIVTEATTEKKTVTTTEATTEEETTEVETEETTEKAGMSSDFKDMLDAYEEYMDEYIEFMQLYNKNPTDAELMSQYMEMMVKYNEYATTISKLDESEMTDEEAAYYIEVTGRVTQKLINAGLSN
jgi:hypothetical protein